MKQCSHAGVGCVPQVVVALVLLTLQEWSTCMRNNKCAVESVYTTQGMGELKEGTEDGSVKVHVSTWSCCRRASCGRSCWTALG